jgi:small subunit ribosomal protein S4
MRKIRKMFKRPRKAWDANRIKAEKKLMGNYGLKNKREFRRAEDMLRGFRSRARDLIATKDAGKEKILIDRLSRLGFLSKGTGLDDVLALNVNDILERRLQTLVHKKGMAKSVAQSRQMIAHGHVYVDGRRTKFPSYMVPVEEEKKIKLIKELKGDK